MYRNSFHIIVFKITNLKCKAASTKRFAPFFIWFSLSFFLSIGWFCETGFFGMILCLSKAFYSSRPECLRMESWRIIWQKCILDTESWWNVKISEKKELLWLHFVDTQAWSCRRPWSIPFSQACITFGKKNLLLIKQYINVHIQKQPAITSYLAFRESVFE